MLGVQEQAEKRAAQRSDRAQQKEQQSDAPQGATRSEAERPSTAPVETTDAVAANGTAAGKLKKMQRQPERPRKGIAAGNAAKALNGLQPMAGKLVKKKKLKGQKS